MAKEKTYWLGELVGSRRVGGIKVDGKLYAIGEPFPADKVDPKKLAAFKKAGRVGSVPFPVAESEPNDARDKDFSLLQGRVSELMEAARVDGDKIAGLALELEVAGDTGDLKNQIVELEGEVGQLKGVAQEADDLKTAHAESHADKKPVIEGLNSEIERLNIEISGLQTDNEEKAALIEKQKAEIKKLKKELKK